jgi:tetratricopeptide (TPR) repeat protein
MKRLAGALAGLMLAMGMAGHCYAQSPREQLQQMVEQLQKNPDDNALREKVIALAAELKPALAVPEDARRAFIRGNTAFASAKDPAGFSRAIERFEEASALAPWWADPYFNLAKAYEGAQDFDRALRALRYFRATATTEADKRQALDLTYALEEKRDLKKTDTAANAKQAVIRTQDQRISGAWKRPHALSDGVPRLQILYVRQTSDGKWKVLMDYYVNNERRLKEGPFVAPDHAFEVVDGELRFKFVSRNWDNTAVCATYDVRGAVSADGNTMNLAYGLMPLAPDRPDDKCPLRSTHSSSVDTYTR